MKYKQGRDVVKQKTTCFLAHKMSGRIRDILTVQFSLALFNVNIIVLFILFYSYCLFFIFSW